MRRERELSEIPTGSRTVLVLGGQSSVHGPCVLHSTFAMTKGPTIVNRLEASLHVLKFQTLNFSLAGKSIRDWMGLLRVYSTRVTFIRTYHPYVLSIVDSFSNDWTIGRPYHSIHPEATT